MARLAGVLAAFLSLLAALPAAQQPPSFPQPVVLRGQVRADDDSSAILRKARVTVAGGPREGVFTDAEGRFEIAARAAPSYALRVSKPGFGPRYLSLPAERAHESQQIRLPRGAAINGRVVDALGFPAVGVEVRVRRVDDETQRDGAAVNVSVETDDLGEFRVGSLPAGTFAISVEGIRVTLTGLGPSGEGRWEPVIRPRGDAAGAAAAPPTVRVRAGEESGVELVERGDRVIDAVRSFAEGYEAAIREAEGRTPAGQVRFFGTATVTGRVTTSTGRAVDAAFVRLAPMTGGRVRIAATDAEGRFQFSLVRPGPYRVAAGRTDFIQSEYGQERAGLPGRIVTVRDRQRRNGVDIAVQPGAVISGAIVDPDGEPLEGVTVHVWQIRHRDGRRLAEAVSDVAVRTTDDRGRYRLHGLQPGAYIVVAADSASPVTRDPSGTMRVQSAPRSYYPGVMSVSDASLVAVDIGRDAVGIDMAFVPSPTFRLRGTAEDSRGVPMQQPVVLTGSSRRDGVALPAQTAVMSGRDFEFPHVAPGDYVLHAIQRLNPADPSSIEYETQAVHVADVDVGGVSLRTTRGATLMGRFLVQGPGTRAPGAALSLDIVPADPDYAPPRGLPPPWTVRVNGNLFEITGLRGAVRFTSTVADGMWLQSMNVGGINAADEVVVFSLREAFRGDVTAIFSTRGAEIAGRVVNGLNEPVGQYTVAVLPVDRTRWHDGSRYLKTTRPDDESRFRVSGIAPGDYFVAAVDTLPDDALSDPATLDRLAQAGRRMTFAAGQRVDVDLPLTSPPR